MPTVVGHAAGVTNSTNSYIDVPQHASTSIGDRLFAVIKGSLLGWSLPSGWTLIGRSHNHLYATAVATAAGTVNHRFSFSAPDVTGRAGRMLTLSPSYVAEYRTALTRTTTSPVLAPSIPVRSGGLLLTMWNYSLSGTVPAGMTDHGFFNSWQLASQAVSAGATGTRALTASTVTSATFFSSNFVFTDSLPACPRVISHAAYGDSAPSISLTPARPTDSVAGDLWVAVYSSTSTLALTVPTGWTTLTDYTSNSRRIAVCWRFDDGSVSPGEFASTGYSSGTEQDSAVLALTCVRNAHPTSPMGDYDTAYNASSTTLSVPAMTALGDALLLQTTFADERSSAGWEMLRDHLWTKYQSSDTAAYSTLAAGNAGHVPAGAYGSEALQWNSDATDPKFAVAVMIEPAPDSSRAIPYIML